MVDNQIEYEKEYFTLKPYNPYFDFPAHKARVSKLIAITRPLSVLDVGCAYGYIVRHLVDSGIPAMGCDVSEWCRGKAESIIPGRFRKTPAWDLSCFGSKEFDVLYCEGVLEHIPVKKIEQLFQEFARVAQRFYLQVSFSNAKGFYREPGHICCHDPQWWIERMPAYTWLGLDDCGTDKCQLWWYKSP